MPVDVLELRDISTETRDDAKASDCAGKNKSFPILKPEDVSAAAKAIGRAGAGNYSADKLKANIIRIAKRKGASFVAKLPKAWTSKTASKARVLEDVFQSRIVELSAAVEGQPRTSWIQVFKTGKFWDPRYGTFSITSLDLSTMLDNFKDGVPKPPTRIPIDYNHGTAHPDSSEAGKAAGWIADLSLRSSGEELWALVEWTPDAADMIENKEYLFVSPQFAFDYRHSTEGEIGTTLLAAAITNTPVLEGMEPLSLSRRGALRLADAWAAPDGSADEEVEAMFSFDEQRRRVQAALSDAFGVIYGFGDCGPCQGCYLVDCFDGRAIYREYSNNGSGDLFEVGFEIDASGDVHFSGTPIEVVADYRQLGEQHMAKTITVKDASGKDVQLAEEVVLALAKDHAPAPVAGTTVDLAKFNELVTKVEGQDTQILELTATNAALKKDAADKIASDRVEKLVRSGHITPADRDEFLTLAKADPKGFEAHEKLFAKRSPSVKYDESRGSGDDGGSATASDQVIALARAAMEKDAKLSTSSAMKIVFKNDPALYERYKQETAVKV